MPVTLKADAVAVLLSEYPSLDERVTLIVDIGTNAEILLIANGRILAASSPTTVSRLKAHKSSTDNEPRMARLNVFELTAIGAVRYQVIGDTR